MVRSTFQRDRCMVLVVDDDRDQARMIRRPLEQAGYRVMLAHSGQECRHVLDAHSVDIILLDVVLGKENGLELCYEIKQNARSKDAFVVFISGARVSSEEQAIGLDMGAEGYIARPIESRELVARIDALARIRHAEHELRNSEALWRSMFDASNDLMLVLDAKGDILYANPKAATTYGISEKELIGSPVFDLIPEADQDAMRWNMGRASQGPIFDTLHLSSDGSHIPVEVALSQFEYQAAAHLMAVIRDLRPREEQERERLGLMQEVIFERERLNNIISSVPGVVWEAWGEPDRSNQRINFVSDYVEQMLGYSVQEWLAEPNFWLKIVHPEDKERAAANAGAAYLKGDPSWQFIDQFRWIKKNGESMWVEAQSRIILDRDGRPSGMRGVTIDISRRKEAESQLQYQVEYNRAIAQHIAEGLVIYDHSEQVTYMNLAAEQMLGYSQSELEGKSLHEMTHYQRADGTSISIEECALQTPLREHRAINNIEETFTRKDGTRIPVLCSSAPLFTNGQLTGAILVFRDISELKQKEEEIRSLNTALEKRVRERTAQLQSANQQLVDANRELEAFSYSVSHDLRAPFRHIVGFSELLEKRAGAQLDDTSKKYVKTISEAAKYAGTLVDHLLSFSRIGRTELRKSPVDLYQLIEESRLSVMQDAESREIEWKVDSDLPKVHGDVTLLRLAFENLLSNAAKYTRKTEHACIEIGVLERNERDITLFVKDNGVGFDMKYVAKLFGVFQRLHRSEEFEGTGIGLANVSRIVQRHGGKVWADSQLGKGATFFVKLPYS